MDSDKLQPADLELVVATEDVLLTVLGDAYVRDNASWTGTPTGPTGDELKDRPAVGRRFWDNTRAKLHGIICGKSETAKAVDSIQASTAAAAAEQMLPILLTALTAGQFTTKVLAIIVGRALFSLGKSKLCEALAGKQDSVVLGSHASSTGANNENTTDGGGKLVN
jgi:hypothetical protein